MADTPKLGLPLIAGEQALKHVTHNEALVALDVLVQLAVEQLGLVTPPLTPVEGQCWLVGVSATGDWSGQDGNIASWTDAGWRFLTPAQGWLLWDKDTGAAYVHDGSGWATLSANTQNMPFAGVNTTADATNKLAVKSNAVLLTALEVASSGTGDMRVVVNKESEADTAAFLFQDGYAGRAEIGLLGSDDFTFKVSADGSAFKTGLTIDRTDGFVTLNKLFGSEPSFPIVASGELNVTTSYAVPAPESGTSDTIETVSGGFDGALLILTGSAGNTLSFADGVGNLKLGGTRVLDNFEDSLTLIKRGSDWIELAYANNG